MHSKYGSNNCWLCLCEVCTRIRCRRIYRRFSLDYCLSMIMRESCPVIKCDFFQHKEKHKVYRIVRKHKKRDMLIERLDSIQKGLDELAGKLE